MVALFKELLETQLMELGTKLVDPPSSYNELLSLLDKLENCLSRVGQSPFASIQNALSPSLKSLVADELLRHSDVDVKVAVASCISEIIRINAPDPPYDDQMEEVFDLIVSSFENLCDKSSQSYTKRTSILETMANVRSCVVMLDLECDSLILEMFQHFLEEIRDYHPENVFSSMEKIMTLILEESEDISVGLLSLIVDSVKNNKKEVLPIARRLGERVLETCAAKVKPYLEQAVKDLGISLDDYSVVVATICQNSDGDAKQSEVQASDEITTLVIPRPKFEFTALLSPATRPNSLIGDEQTARANTDFQSKQDRLSDLAIAQSPVSTGLSPSDLPGLFSLEKSTDPFSETSFCHKDEEESYSNSEEAVITCDVVGPNRAANLASEKCSPKKMLDLDFDLGLPSAKGSLSSVAGSETREEIRYTSLPEKTTDLSGLKDTGKSTTRDHVVAGFCNPERGIMEDGSQSPTISLGTWNLEGSEKSEDNLFEDINDSSVVSKPVTNPDFSFCAASKITTSANLPQLSFPSIDVSVRSKNIPPSLEPTRTENQSKKKVQLGVDEGGDQKGSGDSSAGCGGRIKSEAGYNWRKRKYRMKPVKDSESPRSYYEGTHPNYQVNIKVKRSHEACYHPKPPNLTSAIGSSNPLADMLTRESNNSPVREEQCTPKKVLNLLRMNFEASNLENSQLHLRTSQRAGVSNDQFSPNGGNTNLLNSVVPFQPAYSNKIYCYEARRQKIRNTLKLACERHGLPFAQTWVPCAHRPFDKDSNQFPCAYSTLNHAFYIENYQLCLFKYVCANHHLLKGMGIVGEAFITNKPRFSTDLTSYCKTEYPVSDLAKKYNLHAAIAIPAYWNKSIPPGDRNAPDYVLELFLPSNCTDVEEQKSIVVSLMSVIGQQLCIVSEFKLAQESGSQKGSDVGPIPILVTNDLLSMPKEIARETLDENLLELSNPINQIYLETTPNIRHALVPDAATHCHGYFSSVVEAETSKEIRHTSCREKTADLLAAGLIDTKSTTGVGHTKEAAMGALYKDRLEKLKEAEMGAFYKDWLEKLLMEFGNKLLDPPSCYDELLPLLNGLENCLSMIEQSPSKSMQTALSPSLKALVADKLLRHSDVHVRVAVASCISEIIRITAPDPPYDDDMILKEVFCLIVSAFKNLWNVICRSYTKRTSILKTVANVRSCFVMLDLRCYDLIVRMFGYFLEEIRDYHPENVFWSMEKIMTLILEESEYISRVLLFPILVRVQNDNSKVLPISRKLGERVLEICSAKVKPYLVKNVEDMGTSINDSRKVVATTGMNASAENMATLSSKSLVASSFSNSQEGKSFSQLLDNAMASLGTRPNFQIGYKRTASANVDFRFKHHRRGWSPPSLLDSPGLLQSSCDFDLNCSPSNEKGCFSSLGGSETRDEIRHPSWREKSTDLPAVGLKDAGKSTTGGDLFKLDNAPKFHQTPIQVQISSNNTWLRAPVASSGSAVVDLSMVKLSPLRLPSKLPVTLAEKRANSKPLETGPSSSGYLKDAGKSNTGGKSTTGNTPGKRDPAWEYCLPIKGNSHGVICRFCMLEIKGGGITRFKSHLVSKDPSKNVQKCRKVPDEVKAKVEEWLRRKENKRNNKNRFN